MALRKSEASNFFLSKKERNEIDVKLIKIKI